MDFMHILGQKEATWNTIFSIFERRWGLQTLRGPGNPPLDGSVLPRQFRLSVRLSVTRVICIKTAERIIEILSLSDRPTIILVFRHQGSLLKSDGFTPNGAPNTRG